MSEAEDDAVSALEEMLVTAQVRGLVRIPRGVTYFLIVATKALRLSNSKVQERLISFKTS